jgi:hypothetical protein
MIKGFFKLATGIINGTIQFNGNNISIKSVTSTNGDIAGRNIFVDGKLVERLDNSISNLTIEITGGDIGVIDTGGNVTVHGNVLGKIDTGGDVKVDGNVGDVDAGGDVKVGGYAGNINAGGDVTVKGPAGKITAGGDVSVGR